MQEKEINLVDMIVEILLKWRMIIVWMLCGAVLLGGFSYVKSWRAANAQAAQVEEAKRRLEEQSPESVQEGLETVESALLQKVTGQLTDLQRWNVEAVLAYENWLKSQADAALLQIDANNVQQAEITFYISSESREQSYSIEAVYEDIVSNGELAQYLADFLGMSPYVSELFTLQRNENVLWNGTDTVSISVEEETDSFSVRVIHYDEQICHDMAQAVIDFVKDKHDELVNSLGEHEITVVNSSFAVVYNDELARKQQILISSMMTAQDAVLKRKIDFSAQEWRYYDLLTNGEITGLNSTETVPQSPSIIIARGVTVTPGVSVQYVVFGMAFAAFGCVFFIFMVYILNTKIRVTENLQQLYSIPQLGLIPNERKKKKFLGIIDEWILSLRNRKKRKFSEEEAIKLAAVAVKLNAEREELNSVHLIGCDLKERSIAVCEQLKECLAQNNIQVGILNNVLYDVQTMSDLENAKAVVLVERAGSTLYEEINQELELLNRQGIKVFGGIIVE